MPTQRPPYSAASLDGIINLNKPFGITSAQSLYRVRSISRQRKSGHAGTLDPAATGVLVLCLGKATKLVETIMGLPKIYRATARLDVTSESYDRGRPLVSVDVPTPPMLDDVLGACRSFEGEIEQVPPRISAVKVRGVPAYERARRDEAMTLRARKARIYWLHVHRFDWPELDLELCCGRGTYVRSLIRDLGIRLGTGGCLTSLVRTRVGPLIEADAWSVEAVQEAAGPGEYMIELDKARAILEHAATEIPERPLP